MFDHINLFTQDCFLSSSGTDPHPKQRFAAKCAMLGMDGSPKENKVGYFCH